MRKFSKYIPKLFTISLLLSFVSSGISLCDIVAESCKADTESCCCRHKDENSVPQLKKKCCCEIKENTEQPSQLTLITPDSKPDIKIASYTVHSNSDYISRYISSNQINTFNTPPGGDICIINSNLRI